MTTAIQSNAIHEVEITNIQPLAPGETSILDMHSVVNVLNVLRNEVAILGIMVAEDENHFSQSIAACDQILASLHDHDAALQAAREVAAYENAILAEIHARIPQSTQAKSSADAAETVANIQTVFKILKVRAREILARAADPERWESYQCEDLAIDLRRVFAALEQNSRGRYRILYNAAQQRLNDYYVDLKIEAEEGLMRMPPVFKDVIRDLVANARKYTAPGGHITVALYEDADALQFVVEDNGRGIPSAEVPSVVEFGKRGSNVGDVRTMGGGFGLTKAFFVTKQFGGQFWIASEIDHGTRIRVRIPRPPTG